MAVTYSKTPCIECGAEFERKRHDAQFCCVSCRTSFNNRRKERGAVLYDMFMMLRHERKFAKLHGVWSIMTRLAMYWKEDDLAKREGRRSWHNGKTTLERSSWANATVVQREQRW